MDFAVLISKRAAPDETPSEKARELREKKRPSRLLGQAERRQRERLLRVELGNVDAIALTANDRDRDRAAGSGIELEMGNELRAAVGS